MMMPSRSAAWAAVSGRVANPSDPIMSLRTPELGGHAPDRPVTATSPTLPTTESSSPAERRDCIVRRRGCETATPNTGIPGRAAPDPSARRTGEVARCPKSRAPRLPEWAAGQRLAEANEIEPHVGELEYFPRQAEFEGRDHVQREDAAIRRRRPKRRVPCRQKPAQIAAVAARPGLPIAGVRREPPPPSATRRRQDSRRCSFSRGSKDVVGRQQGKDRSDSQQEDAQTPASGHPENEDGQGHAQRDGNGAGVFADGDAGACGTRATAPPAAPTRRCRG